MLQDPVLARRLAEITRVATAHLTAGVNPAVLFGRGPDDEKFYETVSMFALAALGLRDATAAAVFCDAVRATSTGRRELHPSTVDAIIAETGESVGRTVDDIEESFAGLASSSSAESSADKSTHAANPLADPAPDAADADADAAANPETLVTPVAAAAAAAAANTAVDGAESIATSVAVDVGRPVDEPAPTFQKKKKSKKGNSRSREFKLRVTSAAGGVAVAMPRWHHRVP